MPTNNPEYFHFLIYDLLLCADMAANQGHVLRGVRKSKYQAYA